MSRLSAIGLGLLALVIFPAGLLSCLTCTWRMNKHEWSRSTERRCLAVPVVVLDGSVRQGGLYCMTCGWTSEDGRPHNKQEKPQ